MDKKSINKAIRNAIKLGNINEMKRLIGNDTEILNTITPFGTWLHVAAKKGHLEIVKYLIEVGTELDVSLAKRNPLFGAIYGGHKEVVGFLVEKGIDISIKYTGERIYNMDAYEYAREFGQTEIAEYLKQKLEEK